MHPEAQHEVHSLRMEYLGEFIGTALLITFGHAINANFSLRKTEGENAGWLANCVGWGFTVALCIYIVGRICEAHINPAVTIAMAVIGKFDPTMVPGYILAQVLGAFFGALVVAIVFYPHFAETEDEETVLEVFATTPAIHRPFFNFLAESTATFLLVFGILNIVANADEVMGSGGEGQEAAQSLMSMGLNPLLIGLLVCVIGLGYGGLTSFALNPARDFGPRLLHTLFPFPHKGGSHWGYAWVPICGPITGGIVAALLFRLLDVG